MGLLGLLKIEREFFQVLKRQHKLSRTDVFIILMLLDKPFNERLNVSNLANNTGIDRALILRRIKILSEMGVITSIKEDKERIVEINAYSHEVIKTIMGVRNGVCEENLHFIDTYSFSRMCSNKKRYEEEGII